MLSWDRSFLLLAGMAGATVHVGWMVAGHRVPTPIDGAWALAWSAALFAAFVARARPWAAAVAGVAAWLGATWSQTAVSFPYVDMVRPWGMDWDPYPVFRPPLGLALLVALLPPALAAGWAARRIAARLLALGVIGALIAWWAWPRWFEMDLIAREGVFEQVPTWMPQPGKVGEGTTPAVVGGALKYVHWTEYAYQAEPYRAVRYLAHRELALGALAHGMHLELASNASTFQRRVRAGAWRVAGGLSTGWLYVQLGALPVLVLLVVAGAIRPFPTFLARFTWGVPLLLAALPAAANLGLLAVVALCGLPDARGGAAHVLVESLALLAAVGGLHLAGRAWRGA